MSIVNPDKYSNHNKPKYLQSEIIHQRKQLIFQVEQTRTHVFPNEDYKYYIYLKNVSGVPIENIHIKVNTPNEIFLNEECDDEGVMNIGTLQNDEVKFIYLNAKVGVTGLYHIHFICYGDGSGLYYQTLKINCSYSNISDELIHRIHLYDFNPYENTYYTRADDYSNQVTQLFKTQKLPFKAGEQPFPMKEKDSETSIVPFSNVEAESILEQNDLLKNTKEHVYHYISRENFNENSIESYEGKNLQELINKINRNSKYLKAKLLKTGNNQLKTDLQQYEPNGFIHRFGLLNSEIYHYLGTLPSYSYMSDFLFRWAPDGREPLNLYPKKIAMKWDEKKWSGRGFVVYRIVTEDYYNSNDFDYTKEKLWKIVGYFDNEESANSFKEQQEFFDNVVTSQVKRDYDKYFYEVRESYFDRGVFYIHIPINKIPSNFYLLDTENLEAIIQRSKPFGTKALIRYMVENDFNHNIEFLHTPIYKIHSEINMGEFEHSGYFIQTKKEALINETICGESISRYGLVPYGLTAIYNSPMEHDMNIITEYPKSTVYCADKKQELIDKYTELCQTDECKDKVKDRPYPDNSINQDIEHLIQINSTTVDNSLKTLSELKNILYQNDFTNIAFHLQSNITSNLKINDNDRDISEKSVIQTWMKKNNYKSFSYPITKTFNPNRYKFTQRKKVFCDSFKIPIIQRDLINSSDNEIGIGFIDIYDKYHLFTLKYNQEYNKDYIKYSTVFNNNFKAQKDGLTHTSSLAFKIVEIDEDYKNNLIVFFTENQGKLHYFHHIIVSDLKEVFIFTSEDLAQGKRYVYYPNSNTIVYTDNNGNDLPQGQKTFVVDDVIYNGTPKYEIEPIDISSYLQYSYQNKDKIYLETPYHEEVENYETTNIMWGENWNNLYRLNKAENSYTYIDNKSNEILDVDDILLHFDNINIPQKAIVKEIKLKTILSSSHNKTIYCDTAYQTNHATNNVDGYNLKLESYNIECYHQNNDSQYLYYIELDNAQTIKKEEYYLELIDNNILFDESIDFSENMVIKNPYWIETIDFTDIPYDCNEIDKIELIIEGYNEGEEIDILSQLLYEKDEASIVKQKIPSGYFHETIDLPFSNSFLMDLLRLRFRFDGLNNNIEIFKYYLNVTFKTKQNINILCTETDDVTNINKNSHNLNALIDNDIIGEDINNGISLILSFDSLNPGESYKIYSTELEIVYQEQEISLLINKNKFSSNFDNDDAYITVSGETNDACLSGSFYNDANFISQLNSSTNADNLGFELKDTVYQAFTTINNNITGIEIFPNGFKGSPDATLKLGIYENHGFTPGKLIKEVYVNGWSKSNYELKNLKSIKYEINVNGLKKNKLYWFKLEIDNPKENNYYLLQYTTNRQEDFKLLAKENNNYINTSGSLKFNIYSKNLSTSFNELPAVQDYLVNPYIRIGLHNGRGTIKNLSVKKSQNLIKKGEFR